MIEQKVKDALKTVVDPHTLISVVDMGLIKDIKVEGKKATIIWTPTTPACPMVRMLSDSMKAAVESLEEIEEAEVIMEF
jgi:metal-sulfur cluster biosynthetic enzyme